MSFYGNIANVSKTQMTIDKIYRSRKDMDSEAQRDGIFIGRYVLVDYNYNIYKSHFYLKNNKLFLSVSGIDGLNDVPAEVGKDVQVNEIVRILGKYDTIKWDAEKKQEVTYSIYHNIDDMSATQPTFLRVTGEQGTLEKVDNIEEEEGRSHIQSYNEDKDIYGEGRGFDGTVWMKTDREGAQQYIHIADLNTIVPTFELAIDSPVGENNENAVPYIDGDSTNVYYKIHVQAPWKFNLGTVDLNAEGFDHTKSLSDEALAETNSVTLVETETDNAKYANENKYDTKVLNILVPELGNTISTIWDIVYGHNIKKRPTTIDYKGVPPKADTADKTYNLNTIAGCVNAAQDIIGLLVDEKPALDGLSDEEKENLYKQNLVYKEADKYYVIYKKTIVTQDDLGTLDINESNIEYVYEYLPISLGNGITTLYSGIAQIQRVLGPESADNTDPTTLYGALNTVEGRMEEWKKGLAEAAFHAFGYIADANDTKLAAAATIQNGNVTLPDTLHVIGNDYLSISKIADETKRGIQLNLSVTNDVEEKDTTNKLVTKQAIIDSLGVVSDILYYVEHGEMPTKEEEKEEEE